MAHPDPIGAVQGTTALDAAAQSPSDPRDPHPTRQGIFRDHNCWKCRSGEKPCTGRKDGVAYLCEYPRARND